MYGLFCGRSILEYLYSCGLGRSRSRSAAHFYGSDARVRTLAFGLRVRTSTCSRSRSSSIFIPATHVYGCSGVRVNFLGRRPGFGFGRSEADRPTDSGAPSALPDLVACGNFLVAEPARKRRVAFPPGHGRARIDLLRFRSDVLEAIKLAFSFAASRTAKTDEANLRAAATKIAARLSSLSLASDTEKWFFSFCASLLFVVPEMTDALVDSGSAARWSYVKIAEYTVAHWHASRSV